MIELSSKWFDVLLNQQETGMGYYVVNVVLKDGQIFERVIIDSGCITKVYGYEEIPFDSDEIAQIIVTHDKWDFSKA
jgi:hypothetical protein